MKKHLAMSLVAVCLTALVLTGCKSAPTESAAAAPEPAAAPAAAPAPASAPAPKPAAAPAAAPAPAPVAAPAPAAAPAPKAALPTIRIRAGSTEPLTDSAGNTWLPDQSFDGGDTISRADDLPIANTQDPALYRAERYSMLGFTHALPNGKYVVKLHFAETFEGISGPGQRVFSFNVEGQEFKDFDVWVKAGGPERAYVETVNVEITDGKLDITFTPNMENPEINGIEIIPAS